MDQNEFRIALDAWKEAEKAARTAELRAEHEQNGALVKSGARTLSEKQAEAEMKSVKARVEAASARIEAQSAKFWLEYLLKTARPESQLTLPLGA